MNKIEPGDLVKVLKTPTHNCKKQVVVQDVFNDAAKIIFNVHPVHKDKYIYEWIHVDNLMLVKKSYDKNLRYVLVKVYEHELNMIKNNKGEIMLKKILKKLFKREKKSFEDYSAGKTLYSGNDKVVELPNLCYNHQYLTGVSGTFTKEVYNVRVTVYQGNNTTYQTYQDIERIEIDKV